MLGDIYSAQIIETSKKYPQFHFLLFKVSLETFRKKSFGGVVRFVLFQ